jgi:nicotinate phosphoribosyltransferase
MGTMAPGLTPQDFHSAADLNDPAKWTPGRRIRFSAGWGTLLTNDFRGCHPGGRNGFHPASLICKMTEADGRPAVKLSDNFAKASGLKSEIARYRRVFGMAGVANTPVLV